jgi:hypothetical protein
MIKVTRVLEEEDEGCLIRAKRYTVMQDKYEYLRKFGDKRGNIIHLLYLYSYAGRYAPASVKTTVG